MIVCGMPSAVNPLRIAAGIWISATCRSKSRAMWRCPNSFKHCIQSSRKRTPGSFSDPPHISTRRRRWSPLRFLQSAGPNYFEERRASFHALAPGVSGFHNLAFLRGGITAWAFRDAIASWQFRVSQAQSAITRPVSSSSGI